MVKNTHNNGLSDIERELRDPNSDAAINLATDRIAEEIKAGNDVLEKEERALEKYYASRSKSGEGNTSDIGRQKTHKSPSNSATADAALAGKISTSFGLTTTGLTTGFNANFIPNGLRGFLTAEDGANMPTFEAVTSKHQAIDSLIGGSEFTLTATMAQATLNGEEAQENGATSENELNNLSAEFVQAESGLSFGNLDSLNIKDTGETPTFNFNSSALGTESLGFSAPSEKLKLPTNAPELTLDAPT